MDEAVTSIAAFDRRKWPATEAEIRMYHANLFTAQLLARELIDTGREEKLAEFRRHVSQLATELSANTDEVHQEPARYHM